MELNYYLTEIQQFILQILHPEEIIRTGGLILVVIIIFAETGLFFGFFLPGDSLLFTAGLMTAVKVVDHPIMFVLFTIILAAFAGDLIGYWFGNRAGEELLRRKETMLFKKSYLLRARVFYRKFGSLAIVMGRFLPFIRTFAPIVAGMVKLDYKKFLFYNALGAIIWVASMILSGYFLGVIFPDIIHHLEFILIGLILISALPVINTFIRKKTSMRKPNNLKLGKKTTIMAVK